MSLIEIDLRMVSAQNVESLTAVKYFMSQYDTHGMTQTREVKSTLSICQTKETVAHNL